METSAADLRRASSSSSSRLTVDEDVLGSRLGRGEIVAVVVAERERVAGSGDWMWTCFGSGCWSDEALWGVVMLEAEVEAEWSDREVEDPAVDGAGTWLCGVLIICQCGSASLGFIGKGTGS
jgi:pyruvoyl-dependent arginine decarboxylase (PvlArgDC)